MAEFDNLTDRQRKILFYVVDDFIHRGEAVPSALVARSGVVDVSSATVRNVMGDLEEQGFLFQPHTSAGRVPTAQGMREYVNFLTARPRALRDVDLARLQLEDAGVSDDVARHAGQVLSQISKMAGLVVGPDLAQVPLREIRLLGLSERRVLAILVTEDRQVVERICRVEEPIDALILERIQNYLSEVVTGKSIEEVRDTIRRQLSDARSAYYEILERAVEIGDQLHVPTGNRLHLEGVMNFLQHDELVSDVDRLRELMKLVEDRERLLEIVQGIRDTKSPIAVIGPELGDALGDDLSLVMCGFYRGEESVGVVGVLGPMRMDYARMIPLVDRVARVLSRDVDELAQNPTK